MICSQCNKQATQICRYCDDWFCEEHAILHEQTFQKGDPTFKPAEMEKLNDSM